ncbi:MAG: endolytic transglycosylase MltG [Alphaproteobacteria bacterium]|nr:endolytic transglycosylase MltG [Alphaproteobacteria bacterium]
MSKYRKFFPRYIFAYILFAPVVIALVVFLYVFCIHSTVSVPTVFDVVRGDSVTGVANRLVKNNLIYSKDSFIALVRFHGGKIQSGQYDIPKSASLWRIVRMMTNGNVATTNIVIPEGLTVKQIKQMLLQHSELTGAVECDKDKNRPVCNLKDGQLFPDTYRVARGTPRLAVLELMRKKMLDVNKHIKSAYRVLPKPLKNWDEVLVLASIVQKETPIVREMPIVSSVYLNRLNKGMRLQADPTVVYALTDGVGDMQGKALLRGHLKIDSPYNTYRNSGLPPTPIANVGQNAIRAVIRPAETNFLFFVADGQGGHRFSIDYAQHQKNHDAWRKIKNSKN